MTEEIGGGVAIDKDILPSQRDFFPTATEHLSSISQQIIKFDSMANGGVTLYTVPENHIFYLTSAFLSINCIGGVAASRSGTLREDIGDNILMFLGISLVGGHSTSSQQYFPPLKFEPNSSIIATSSSVNLMTYGAITGFLVKKNIV